MFIESHKFLRQIRRCVAALLWLAAAATIGTACEPAVESGEPAVDDRATRIAQRVAATLEAQRSEQSAVVATAVEQPAPTRPVIAAIAATLAAAHQTSSEPVVAATAAPSSAPTGAPEPAPTAVRVLAPTAIPQPTATPAPRPTPTPQWRPPTAQELAELRQLVLEVTNAERAKHGAPALRLGDNRSPQIHAEQSLANCYTGHWDLWGLKPLYRYTLAGGDQYAEENADGNSYGHCPQAGDGYGINSPTRWDNVVREAVVRVIGSPSHHRTMIDPRHTVLHAGIAMSEYGINLVQVFSGDYVIWADRPKISNRMLTAAGQLQNAFWDKNGRYIFVSIDHHPPAHRLTIGQVSGAYCLERDINVGSLRHPLAPGGYYTDQATGRRYTDYTTYTRDSKQCVNPYELPADRPAPTSMSAADAAFRAAAVASNSMPHRESVAYFIVSERLDISADGRKFSILADLSPILSHYGPGIYTITIWATTPAGKPRPVAEYPIWWQSEPTPGHPY